MALTTTWIDTKELLESLCHELQNEAEIAVDTEFIRESTFYPMVEIIQVATRTKSWLIDAKPFLKDQSAFDSFRKILASPTVLKIFHAAQGDQECLYTAFGIVATPSVDTAIAASLCGYGESIGLSSLLKQALGVEIKKGHARTNWSVRPLPEQLKLYALEDVRYLIQAFEKLKSELEKLDRLKWAFTLSQKYEDKKLYEANPLEMADKIIRGSKFDRESASVMSLLMVWREKRVRELNVPRRWLADDQVLSDLAKVKPKDIGHMSAFRGLNKGEIKNQGATLLEIIKKGIEDSSKFEWTKNKRTELPSNDEAQVIELMKCYVSVLASKNQVSLKNIIQMSMLLPLIRSEAQSAQDWVTEGLLSQEANALVGEELFALLSGNRALSIKNRKLEIKPIS